MDLSPNEIADIKQAVEETARALHTAHLTRGEGSLEYFMSFCDEDVFAIGTGLEEVMDGKSSLQSFIESPDAIRALTGPLQSAVVETYRAAFSETFLAMTVVTLLALAAARFMRDPRPYET